MTTKLTRKSPLLTVGEAARLLGIHENTLRRWTDAGQLIAYIVNGRGDRRYKRRDISRYLEAGTTKQTD